MGECAIACVYALRPLVVSYLKFAWVLLGGCLLQFQGLSCLMLVSPPLHFRRAASYELARLRLILWEADPCGQPTPRQPLRRGRGE